MKNRSILYAPWRETYANKEADSNLEESTANNCIFCKKIASKNDEQEFILSRFKHTIVLLNLYPYNAGHLLFLPVAHQAYPHKLEKEAYIELMQLASFSIPILQAELKAQGVNVGLNLGKAAGAGIPAHLHLHVLPRWNGDTNFMPTLAQTKQISFDLKKIYDTLKPAFDKINL